MSPKWPVLCRVGRKTSKQRWNRVKLTDLWPDPVARDPARIKIYTMKQQRKMQQKKKQSLKVFRHLDFDFFESCCFKMCCPLLTLWANFSKSIAVAIQLSLLPWLRGPWLTAAAGSGEWNDTEAGSAGIIQMQLATTNTCLLLYDCEQRWQWQN